jgi:acetylornithine deacetylase/succinyl-diaminopimelate desuccinylase-like protein
MIRVSFIVAALLFTCSASAQDRNSEHARKALEIYTNIIEMETSKNLGNVPAMAEYLADELIGAGLPEADVEILPVGETAALIARYRGDGSSGKKPILLLAHMDVVEARPEDWERPPFKLTKDDTYFYARGTVDNKFGVTQLTSTFIRFKREGFVPNRDLIIVFTGDEESTQASTEVMAYERPDIAEAEYALNSDSWGGQLSDDGKVLSFLVQTSEKTYATWEITARNPGGHSSLPRIDNAIYDLADAIRKIQGHKFPVRWNDTTLEYLEETGHELGGELGEALVQFAQNPEDEAAAERLWTEPFYVGNTRTTCIPTMLSGGHAENALPQSATMTVNCRIFPGVPASDVQKALQEVIGNEALEFKSIWEPMESPVSDLREEIRAAVSESIHSRHPGVKILGYMSAGGTDGVYFRTVGIPTWAMGGIIMNPKDVFAHGLNERIPIDAFYGALDHWSIIIKNLASD